MVGIPGQTLDSIAGDLLRFQEMDLDMIGIGPYIADPDTPLAQEMGRSEIPGQAASDETTVLKVVALTRTSVQKVTSLLRQRWVQSIAAAAVPTHWHAAPISSCPT